MQKNNYTILLLLVAFAFAITILFLNMLIAFMNEVLAYKGITEKRAYLIRMADTIMATNKQDWLIKWAGKIKVILKISYLYQTYIPNFFL